MNLTAMEVSGCSKRFAGWSRGTILKMFGKILSNTLKGVGKLL